MPIEDIFANGQVTQEVRITIVSVKRSRLIEVQPKWYPLQSRRTGKKKSIVSGEVLVQFSIVDPVHSSATPQQLYQKFCGLVSVSPDPDEADEDLERMSSTELDEEEEDEEEALDETDENKEVTKEKRKKRLKIAKLRRKAKQRAYEFSGNSEVAGVLFLEISKITDLPPERNSKSGLPSTLS